MSYLSATLLIALFGCAISYPTGAPEETCKVFTALHTGHTVQTGTSNYHLTISPSSVAPGGTVTVTLHGSSGDQFKGFFVQGQDVTTKKPEGKFQAIPNKSQTRDCSGPGSANAITHVDPNDKSSVQMTWIAPASFQGTVVFRAVVVKDYEHFWNNIYSDELTVA